MYRTGQMIPSAEVQPNSEPKVGAIAIIDYKVRHYAYVEGIFDNGSILLSECNMWYLYETGCGYRVVPSDYDKLVGFYSTIDK